MHIIFIDEIINPNTFPYLKLIMNVCAIDCVCLSRSASELIPPEYIYVACAPMYRIVSIVNAVMLYQVWLVFVENVL